MSLIMDPLIPLSILGHPCVQQTTCCGVTVVRKDGSVPEKRACLVFLILLLKLCQGKCDILKVIL